MTHDYVRNGTTSLFAAFDVSSGSVIAQSYRIDRRVRIGAVGPGPAARLERHHERQPGPGQLAAEPVLVAVGAVRGDSPEREPRIPGPDRQISADRQLGPERRVVLPLAKCPAGV
jgi:hypothetical protein